jgi:hypothetical protein
LGSPGHVLFDFEPGVRQLAGMFEPTTAAVIYSLLVAVVFIGAWFYYDRRDHASFQAGRRKTAFHCIRCDRLYAAPAGTEMCICPACGHENARLKF